MNLALIQTSMVALNAAPAAVLFNNPIPIISNTDPVMGEEVVSGLASFTSRSERRAAGSGLSARLLSDCLWNASLKVDRFGSAADALARFGLAS